MKIKKILSTILVVLWMITVFCFSNQQGNGSSSTSKSVTMVIIDILNVNNNIPETTKQEIIRVLEPIIRKLAHYTLYIVGGVLLINCFFSYYCIINKKMICISAIIGVIYSISDELHQLFINGRSGKITDVIIDSIGVFTGIAIYILFKKIVKQFQSRDYLEGGE